MRCFGVDTAVRQHRCWSECYIVPAPTFLPGLWPRSGVEVLGKVTGWGGGGRAVGEGGMQY